MNQILRICMLNADVPVPKVVAERSSTYGQIFHKLIATTAARTSPHVTIKSQDYDVRKGEYPESLSDVDLILITGSASSAYDDLEWIRRLDLYVLDIYVNHPRVKMFGSCFGHQIICQSLLKQFGVKVEPDTNGWELGVQEIALEKPFREAMKKDHQADGASSIDEADKIRLQFVHHDHVVLPSPETLPSSWMMVGSTQHCAIQGVYERGRVFTLQGHFEFDRFINSETIKTFFASWEPELLEDALKAIDADDDSESAIEMLLQFMQEDVPVTYGTP
jgi:GMP synthase-like glutamine amidotransferase